MTPRQTGDERSVTNRRFAVTAQNEERLSVVGHHSDMDVPEIVAGDWIFITGIALRAPDRLRLAEKSRRMIEDCKKLQLVERGFFQGAN